MRVRELMRLGLAILLLANTATGTASVSATIVASCSISGSTLAFGSYDPIVTNNSSALTVSGAAFTVSCTRGATGITIGLGTGNHSANAVGTTRAMASGTNYLSYELYTTSAMSTVWNTSNTVSYAPTSMASMSETVYGSIPGGQDVPVSSYSDSVTATVNF
jgi:spore coat protein U-like protein